MVGVLTDVGGVPQTKLKQLLRLASTQNAPIFDKYLIDVKRDSFSFFVCFPFFTIAYLFTSNFSCWSTIFILHLSFFRLHFFICLLPFLLLHWLSLSLSLWLRFFAFLFIPLYWFSFFLFSYLSFYSFSYILLLCLFLNFSSVTVFSLFFSLYSSLSL